MDFVRAYHRMPGSRDQNVWPRRDGGVLGGWEEEYRDERFCAGVGVDVTPKAKNVGADQEQESGRTRGLDE